MKKRKFSANIIKIKRCQVAREEITFGNVCERSTLEKIAMKSAYRSLPW